MSRIQGRLRVLHGAGLPWANLAVAGSLGAWAGGIGSFWTLGMVFWKRKAIVTLWLFNIVMENGPFIDGLPIEDGDFPWLC